MDEIHSQTDTAKDAVRPAIKLVAEKYKKEFGEELTIYEKPSKFILRNRRQKLAVVKVFEYLNRDNYVRKGLIIKSKSESSNPLAEDILINCDYNPTRLVLA